MKIGPAHRTSSRVDGPVKKALLIGINYTNAPPHPEYQPLCHARDDTKEFADLLIAKYGYRRENIVMLLDEEEVDFRYAPTRDNILREIRKLVHGARSGDSFMFYYSGHSGQVESPNTEEDDGMDEYLVPVDHWQYPEEAATKKRMILDNKLRKLLVDTLPNDANLTAIFDSCHSGTLLDLDHYLCNNVYFPWSSPGFRNQRTMWRQVRRKNGYRKCSAVSLPWPVRNGCAAAGAIRARRRGGEAKTDCAMWRRRNRRPTARHAKRAGGLPQIKSCTVAVYWKCIGSVLGVYTGAVDGGHSAGQADGGRLRDGRTRFAHSCADANSSYSPPRSTCRARLHVRAAYSYRTVALAEQPRTYTRTHSRRSSQIWRPGAAAPRDITSPRPPSSRSPSSSLRLPSRSAAGLRVDVPRAPSLLMETSRPRFPADWLWWHSRRTTMRRKRRVCACAVGAGGAGSGNTADGVEGSYGRLDVVPLECVRAERRGPIGDVSDSEMAGGEHCACFEEDAEVPRPSTLLHTRFRGESGRRKAVSSSQASKGCPRPETNIENHPRDTCAWSLRRARTDHQRKDLPRAPLSATPVLVCARTWAENGKMPRECWRLRTRFPVDRREVDMVRSSCDSSVPCNIAGPKYPRSRLIADSGNVWDGRMGTSKRTSLCAHVRARAIVRVRGCLQPKLTCGMNAGEPGAHWLCRSRQRWHTLHGTRTLALRSLRNPAGRAARPASIGRVGPPA